MSNARHPYINANDFIRSISSTSLSRSDASAIRMAMSGGMGVTDIWLACVLSVKFQGRKGKPVTHSTIAQTTYFPDVTLDRLVEAIAASSIGMKITPEDCVGIAAEVIQAMDPYRPVSVSLTQDQIDRLPDLVALAMAGSAILKNDPGTPESENPAIRAFMPLVQDEFDLRAADAREKFERAYGTDPGL